MKLHNADWNLWATDESPFAFAVLQPRYRERLSQKNHKWCRVRFLTQQTLCEAPYCFFRSLLALRVNCYYDRTNKENIDDYWRWNLKVNKSWETYICCVRTFLKTNLFQLEQLGLVKSFEFSCMAYSLSWCLILINKNTWTLYCILCIAFTLFNVFYCFIVFSCLAKTISSYGTIQISINMLGRFRWKYDSSADLSLWMPAHFNATAHSDQHRPERPAFLLCQDNPSTWQVWHIRMLIKQYD